MRSSAASDVYKRQIPAHEGHICQIDFSKLNLYFYKSSYSSSMDVTPKFEIYSGTEATGEPIYVHTQDNNLKSGGDPSAIGTIRSTSPDGALTILFNATTSNSTSTSKGADYGIAAIVSEYQSKPMTLTSARGISSGLEAVAISSAVNVPAVGLVVTTDGDSSPITLDNVTFGIKADASVYTAVKLAASGKRASYKDAEVIATGEITPEGEVTFTPAIPLAEGENHFWLLGDISPEAAPATIIDAKINTLTINGEPATVDNADPEGEIRTVNTYDPILGNKEQVVEVGQYPVLINGVTAAYMTNEYTITARPAYEGGKVTATFTEGALASTPSPTERESTVSQYLLASDMPCTPMLYSPSTSGTTNPVKTWGLPERFLTSTGAITSRVIASGVTPRPALTSRRSWS